MVNCAICGQPMELIGEHEGGRSFELFECPEGHRGGRAWGCGLPDETWGAVGQEAIAVGGEV